MELAAAGPGAARGAVPVRGRDAGLPLARRPRPPPGRLPGRGVGERPPPVAAAMRMSGTQGGPGGAGRGGGGGGAPHGAPLHRRRDPAAALRPIRRLWEHGAAVSLDLLGEATVTEAEADRYAARCREALDTLAAAGARVAGAAGAGARLPRACAAREPVGEGLGAEPLLRPEAPDVGRDDAARRMRPLLLRARELGAHLHIDMESVDTLEATTDLVFDVLDEPELRDGPAAGIVIQAYLRESREQLERVLDWAARAGAGPRSRCGSSRAPTGTTRWWRRASTGGLRPCTRRRRSPTGASRTDADADRRA